MTETPFVRRTLPIVLYPAATPVAAVLFLGTAVASHPIWILRPLAVVIVVSIVLTVIVTIIVGDRHRAGVASWALIVGLTVADLRVSVLLWALAGVLVATSLVTKRQSWPRGPRISSGLSVFSIVLVAATIAHGIVIGGLQAAVEEIAFDLGGPGPVAVASNGQPDIYFVLLDAYPGPSASLGESDFDANLLPDALRARGFDVAGDSRANYLITRLSVPSLFNARHIADIESLTHPGTEVDDSRALRLATERSPILRLLGEAGYERVALSSGFSELGPVRVDRLIVPPQLTEMEAAIFNGTAAVDVVNTISPDYLANQVRTRILDSFAAAGALAEEPRTRPRFAFLHIPAPHAPWVTDALGNLSVGGGDVLQASDIVSGDLTDRERRFYQYATWVDGLTVSMIDRILAGTSRAPIIAVFSDHGPDFDFDTDDPLGSNLDSRSSILMAVLAPGHPDLLPDDATLVNLFPTVLNAYLDAGLAMQPDTVWAWKAKASTLDLVELDPRTWKAK